MTQPIVIAALSTQARQLHVPVDSPYLTGSASCSGYVHTCELLARLAAFLGGKLKDILKYFDLVLSMAPTMMVAAVSAPTASSTGQDMSMGAPSGHIERQTPGRDGIRQACLWQASAYDPGEASCRVVLATLTSPR